MCNLKFGYLPHKSSGYNLQFYDGKERMNLFNFNSFNNQYKIIRQRATREEKRNECCSAPFVSLDFKFSLQRKFVLDLIKGRIENPLIGVKNDYLESLMKLG